MRDLYSAVAELRRAGRDACSAGEDGMGLWRSGDVSLARRRNPQSRVGPAPFDPGPHRRCRHPRPAWRPRARSTTTASPRSCPSSWRVGSSRCRYPGRTSGLELHATGRRRSCSIRAMPAGDRWRLSSVSADDARASGTGSAPQGKSVRAARAFGLVIRVSTSFEGSYAVIAANGSRRSAAPAWRLDGARSACRSSSPAFRSCRATRRARTGGAATWNLRVLPRCSHAAPACLDACPLATRSASAWVPPITRSLRARRRCGCVRSAPATSESGALRWCSSGQRRFEAARLRALA